MLRKFGKYWSLPTLACYDNDPPADPPPVDPPADPPPVDPPADPPPPPKTFDQAAVNKFLADERRKTEARIKALAKQDLEKQANTYKELIANSEGELKAQLQAKHDEVEAKLAEHRSEKENLLKQAKQVKDELSGKLTAAEKQAKEWEQRYQDSSIKRELLDAASQNDAFSAQQMVNMLKANTKLVAVKDEAGKETGEYQVMVSLEDVVEDKPVITVLSPDAALKRMKQLPMYQNLFKAGVVPGVGATPVHTPLVPTDVKNMTQAQYNELRKKDPQKLYKMYGAK